MVKFNPNFILKEGTDKECTTTKADGKTTVSCENLNSGYAGATYTLEITIETVQADQKWTYTVASGSTTNAYKPGDEITVAGETFNVIKDNGDTVTMLAQFNLDSTYKQSETTNYVTYLKGSTGDITITGTLITLAELKELGCTINDDYSYTSVLTCANSENADWLVSGQYWWTHSAYADDSILVWSVGDDGGLDIRLYDDFGYGVRPVITISKSALQ